jgi:hypothetical protein
VFGESRDLFEIEEAENDIFPKYYGIAAERCGFWHIAVSSYKILLSKNTGTINPKELQKKIKELEDKIK